MTVIIAGLERPLIHLQSISLEFPESDSGMTQAESSEATLVYHHRRLSSSSL